MVRASGELGTGGEGGGAILRIVRIIDTVVSVVLGGDPSRCLPGQIACQSWTTSEADCGTHRDVPVGADPLPSPSHAATIPTSRATCGSRSETGGGRFAESRLGRGRLPGLIRIVPAASRKAEVQKTCLREESALDRHHAGRSLGELGATVCLAATVAPGLPGPLHGDDRGYLRIEERELEAGGDLTV